MEVVVLGLSDDVVANEMALLARLKMAHSFEVPLDEVQCSIYLSGNRMCPEFSVDRECVGKTDEEITGVLQSVWSEVKPELERRLTDLRTYRGGQAKAKEAS